MTLRQVALYLPPLLVSLTAVFQFERFASGRGHESFPPFASISWRGCWLPFAASLICGRAVIVAPAKPINENSASLRLAAHLILTALGFALYTWSLGQQPDFGLPPIHHWWAKVLMYFNLCMAGLNLLPIRGLLVGEWLHERLLLPDRWFDAAHAPIWLTLLAASPLLDLLLGGWVIYPIYGWLANMAQRLAG